MSDHPDLDRDANVNGDTSESPTAIDSDRELSERLTALEARVEQQEKSLVKRIGAMGGLVALVISITLGAIGLVDRLHFQRLAEIRNNTDELDGIVQRLSEINWKLVELDLENNPIRMQSLGQVVNGEKIALVERADRIAKDLEFKIGFSPSFALAYENLTFGRIERSVAFAERAIATAPNEGMRAEAKRYLARSFFSPGPLLNQAQARALYAEVISEAKSQIDFAAIAAANNAYLDWTMGELFFGDCAKAAEVYSEAMIHIQTLPNAAIVRSAFAQQIAHLGARQSRCAVPSEVSATKN